MATGFAPRWRQRRNEDRRAAASTVLDRNGAGRLARAAQRRLARTITGSGRWPYALRGVLAGVALACGAATASAAPADTAPADTEPRWYFRLGLLRVTADLDSTELGLGQTRLGLGAAATQAVAVEPLLLPGGNIGYVLPVLNHRISLETIIGIPIKAKVVATGTLANESILPTVLGVPTGIPPLGSELAEAGAVGELVTAVYHLPTIGPVTPLVGAGVLGLLSVDVEITNPVLSRYINLAIDVPPSLGTIVQAGIDIRLWGRVQARIDLKYISVTAVTVIKNIQVKSGSTILGTVDFDNIEINASAHAWITQAGVGLDF